MSPAPLKRFHLLFFSLFLRPFLPSLVPLLLFTSRIEPQLLLVLLHSFISSLTRYTVSVYPVHVICCCFFTLLTCPFRLLVSSSSTSSLLFGAAVEMLRAPLFPSTVSLPSVLPRHPQRTLLYLQGSTVVYHNSSRRQQQRHGSDREESRRRHGDDIPQQKKA